MATQRRLNNDLITVLKEDPHKVSIGGGSAAGGFDHLKVLQIARASGVEKLGQIKYIAFPGGGEAITQVLSGHIQGFTGDVSEILEHLQSGNIRPNEAYEYWVDALKKVYESEEWQQIMADSGLMSFHKTGEEFKAFVDQQVAEIEELSRSIGLIKKVNSAFTPHRAQSCSP